MMTKIPIYKTKDILDAIKREGLLYWGYKTPYCIWVFTDGMEDDDIWSQFPSPLTGYEVSIWSDKVIERVTYFLLEGYSGNLNRLEYQVENPSSKDVIPDDDQEDDEDDYDPEVRDILEWMHSVDEMGR